MGLFFLNNFTIRVYKNGSYWILICDGKKLIGGYGMKQKKKCIATINIEGNTYSIRVSTHAQKRMQERNISSYVIAGNILSLGKNRLLQLQKSGEDFIIIDDITNTSIVAGFKNNRMFIITVIDKCNIFVKSETQVVNL